MRVIVPNLMDKCVGKCSTGLRNADYIYNVNLELEKYYYLAGSFNVQLPNKVKYSIRHVIQNC